MFLRKHQSLIYFNLLEQSVTPYLNNLTTVHWYIYCQKSEITLWRPYLYEIWCLLYVLEPLRIHGKFWISPWFLYFPPKPIETSKKFSDAISVLWSLSLFMSKNNAIKGSRVAFWLFDPIFRTFLHPLLNDVSQNLILHSSKKVSRCVSKGTF